MFKIVIFVLVLVGVFAAYFWGNQEHRDNGSNQDQSVINVKQTKTLVPQEDSHVVLATTSRSTSDSDALISPPDPSQWTANHASAANDWLHENGLPGYFDPTKEGGIDYEIMFGKGFKTSYEYYDIETLKGMADSDRRAMLVLAMKVYKEVSFENAIPYLSSSAVDGFYRPFTTLYFGYLRKGVMLTKNNKPAEADKAYIEGLAWHQVHLLVNDTDTEINNQNTNLEMDSERADQLIEKAKARSKEIFSDLLAKRTEAGLDAYDQKLPSFLRVNPQP